MLKFQYINNSFGKVITDSTDELMQLWDHYSYNVPGARFMPAFKRGTWDGKIRLINLSKRTFPVGLYGDIIEWCELSSIEYEADKKFTENKSIITEDEVHDFVNQFKYYSKGKEIIPRNDQLEAITRAITNSRCINICPTSFGKSLCIFIEALWHIQFKRKIIIIVPTVSLVHQFYSDIKDYCTDENKKLNNFPNIQEIYAGQSKEIAFDIDIVISTWQSLYNLDKEWINQFDCVILDEAHKGKADCLSDIFNNAENVQFRTGWTGSLKSASITQMQIEALIGPAKVITDTRTLMDNGIVANLKVKVIRLMYPDSTKEEFKKHATLTLSGKATRVAYPDEITFIENYSFRTKLLINMAAKMPNTGLLLYTRHAHGIALYEAARKLFPNKNIYRIDGSTVLFNDKKYKSYNELKEQIENEKDAILICSFGVFSTGVSIKNLHYIMFTTPIKSFVRTIQSIGRVLRVSDTKRKAILFDIVDDFSSTTKSGKTTKENYAFKQFKERFSMYAEQKFSYDIFNLKL